jgi:hypothetical protein
MPLKAVENFNNHIVVVGGRGIEFRDIKSKYGQTQ